MHVLLHQVERRVHRVLLLLLLLMLQLQVLLQMQLMLLLLLLQRISSHSSNMLQWERVRRKLTLIAATADDIASASTAAAAIVIATAGQAVAAGAAGIGTRQLIGHGARLLRSLGPRWTVVDAVTAIKLGLVLLLPLHAPVLEPDFYLTLSQAESMGNLNPTASGQIPVEMKFLLQLQGLVSGVGLTATLAL